MRRCVFGRTDARRVRGGRGEEGTSTAAGVAAERCAMECDDGNMSNDAGAMCQVIDDCAGVAQPHDLVAEGPEVVTTVNILVMNANVLLG